MLVTWLGVALADAPAPPVAPDNSPSWFVTGFDLAMNEISQHGNLTAGYGLILAKGSKAEHGESIGMLADIITSSKANVNYPWGLGFRYDLINVKIATRQVVGLGWHQTLFKLPTWFQSHLGNIPVLPNFSDFAYNAGVETRPEIIFGGVKSIALLGGASLAFGPQKAAAVVAAVPAAVAK